MPEWTLPLAMPARRRCRSRRECLRIDLRRRRGGRATHAVPGPIAGLRPAVLIARRRHLLAILASVGFHAAAGVLVVGSSLWGVWSRPPIDVEITGMRLEDLQDLPLGLPAAGEQRPDAVVAPPPRAPQRPRTPQPVDKTDPQEVAAKAERKRGPHSAEADPDGGAAPPRPTSVRSYAPEGSRVTALLRVDRLRDTPYAAAVDALLLHLPDRRDLLEGTGVDLYRDIDALLIATPNPMDATVTFLAARHRLSDGALRAALERGARATGRKLTWRTERGRPFAERRSGKPAPAGGSAGASGASGAVNASAAADAPGNRDQRLILLPAPKLVVVTPAAYRSLILRGRPPVASGAPGGRSAQGGSDGRANPDGGARGSDAGADGGGQPAAMDDGTGWALLVRRIDAEDSVLPPNAVAMVSAVDLFSARTLRPALDVVPGTRGAVDDGPALGAAGATVMGLPVPRMLTATLGVTPQPFAEIDAEFSGEPDAARWEQEWPALRRKLLTNPLVVLSGFGGLVGRLTLARQGVVVHLHVDATELEATRILGILAAQMPPLGR